MNLGYKHQIKKASMWKNTANHYSQSTSVVSAEEFFYNNYNFDDVFGDPNVSNSEIESLLRTINSFLEKGENNFIPFFVNNNIFKFVFDSFVFFTDKSLIPIQTIISLFRKNIETIDIFMNSDFINILMEFMYAYVGDNLNNIPNERFISNVISCIYLISGQSKYISLLHEKDLYNVLTKILNDGIDLIYENQDGSDTDIIIIEKFTISTLSNLIILSDFIENENNTIKLFFKIIENRKFYLLDLISLFLDKLIIKKNEMINVLYNYGFYNIIFETISDEENDEETISFVNAYLFLIDSIYYCNDNEMNERITSIFDIDTLFQVLSESQYALTKKRYINLFSQVLLLLNNVIAVQKLPYDFDFDLLNSISTIIMENGHIYLKENLIQLILTIIEVSTYEQVLNIVKLDSINLIFESLEDGEFELSGNAINVINNILSKYGKYGSNDSNEQYITFTTEIIPNFLNSYLNSSKQYQDQIMAVLQAHYSSTTY